MQRLKRVSSGLRSKRSDRNLPQQNIYIPTAELAEQDESRLPETPRESTPSTKSSNVQTATVRIVTPEHDHHHERLYDYPYDHSYEQPYDHSYDNTYDAPRIGSLHISPFVMDGQEFSKIPESYTCPNLLQTSPLALRTDPSQRRALPPRSVSVQRKPLAPLGSRVNSRSEGVSVPSPPTTPTPEDDLAWSSAIGRAALGKSGRVIERLMADIDRLKKSLNAEITHRQEVEKREETSQQCIEALRREMATLQQRKDIDAGALMRRDRKIEELTANLEGERRRRTNAEARAKEAVQVREKVEERCAWEINRAGEHAKMAETHAQVLEQSYRELKTEYQERMDVSVEDIRLLKDERDEEGVVVTKLDVVVEQMRHELDHANGTNAKLAETFAMYKQISEGRIQHLEREKALLQAGEDGWKEDAERALKEAKWLLRVGHAATALKGS